MNSHSMNVEQLFSTSSRSEQGEDEQGQCGRSRYGYQTHSVDKRSERVVEAAISQ